MKLTNIQVLNEKETRGGFGEGIHEIGKENENVVVLTADLAGSLKLGPFIKDFPNRFVQVGIAEANMIGIHLQASRWGGGRNMVPTWRWVAKK